MKKDGELKEITDILIAEYQEMRNEIRLYINKLYLGLTATFTLLTAGVFTSNTDKTVVFICLPYIIFGIFGFMAMVSFFINKTASYVKLTEKRISLIYGASSFSTCDAKDTKREVLPLLLWESYYADFGLDRDKNKPIGRMFGVITMTMMSSVLILIGIVIFYGASSIDDDKLRILYVSSSIGLNVFAGLAYALTGPYIRKRCSSINDLLLLNYIQFESKDLSTDNKQFENCVDAKQPNESSS